MFSSIFVLLIYLGYISYRSNPKNSTNRYFSYLCFFVAVWSFFYFFENEITNLYFAKLFLYLDFIFGVFMVYYFFLFIAAYTSSEIIKYKNYVLSYTIFIDVLLVLGFIITDIHWLNDVLVFQLRPLFFLYALQPFVLTIFSLIIFIKKVIASRGFIRMQFLYSLSGLLISSIIILISTQILPQLGIIDINISRIGISGILFFILFTAYAILKYRLMDIRVIIRRSAVFAVLVAIITTIYALLAYLISVSFQGIIGTQSIVLNGIITAVLVAIGFEPLKKWLSEITDRFLFKAAYHPQEVLAEFSDNLSATLDIDVLTKFMASRLCDVFKPQFVSLFL
ncbi:histidine kinase N-terminal 7TM domain-containing protein, partial [Patescibacteria group bacterium]